MGSLVSATILKHIVLLYGLEYDAKHQTAYGICQDACYTLYLNKPPYHHDYALVLSLPIKASFFHPYELNQYVDQIKQAIPELLDATYTPYHLRLYIPYTATCKKVFRQVLEHLRLFLKNTQSTCNICEKCGQSPAQLYSLKDSFYYHCIGCAPYNKPFRAHSLHLILKIIGFGLIGVFCSFFFSFLGSTPLTPPPFFYGFVFIFLIGGYTFYRPKWHFKIGLLLAVLGFLLIAFAESLYLTFLTLNSLLTRPLLTQLTLDLLTALPLSLVLLIIVSLSASKRFSSTHFKPKAYQQLCSSSHLTPLLSGLLGMLIAFVLSVLLGITSFIFSFYGIWLYMVLVCLSCLCYRFFRGPLSFSGIIMSTLLLILLLFILRYFMTTLLILTTFSFSNLFQTLLAYDTVTHYTDGRFTMLTSFFTLDLPLTALLELVLYPKLYNQTRYSI